MRNTHTLAHLAISEPAHREIGTALREAGYDHVFLEGDVIDMHGIGLVSYIPDGVTPRGPVLMNRENPTGWKLEDLLDQLLDEVCAQTLKLSDHMRTPAFQDETDAQQSTTRAVVFNNREISRFLRAAKDRRDQSMALLARLSRDEGPTGTPRIGPQPGVKAHEVIATTGHDD